MSAKNLTVIINYDGKYCSNLCYFKTFLPVPWGQKNREEGCQYCRLFDDVLNSPTLSPDAQPKIDTYTRCSASILATDDLPVINAKIEKTGLSYYIG